MTPLDKFKEVYARRQEKQNEAQPITLEEKVSKVVEVKMGDQIPDVKPITKLVKSPPGGDDEIIADRFLCRAGGLLFPAPTGIGKSTFVIQMACQAALGHEAYGLRFVRPTKFLYVQAENDDSDLAGMRDGIFDGMGFSSDEIKQIGENLLVLTESNRTGINLIDYLAGVVAEYSPHVVILDPIFSYLGGNASEQAAVSMFLRNMLNPMMLDQNVACWLVHHTNKPPSGVEKREWSGGEFAYLGAGSAEWANWARATLTIRQIGLDGIFELRAGKRGGRLGWEDSKGGKVHHRYIAHAKGSILWQDADWDAVMDQLGGNTEKRHQGRPSKEIDLEAIKDHDGYPFVTKEGAIEAVMGLAKCARRTAITIIDRHMIRLGDGENARWKVG